MHNKIYKVIYFDENSAGDYLNIANGGIKVKSNEESTEVENYWERYNKFTLTLAGSASFVLGALGLLTVDTQILRILSAAISLLGGIVSISPLTIGIVLGKKTKDKKLVVTQVTSDVLTQFLEASSKAEGKIVKITGHKIAFPENSFTYIKNITPIIDLIKDRDFEALPFNISKLGQLIDDLKGYYSSLAIDDEGNIKVLRFNSKALRNNYRFSDLLIMKLVFYVVRIGDTSGGENSLSIENEFKNHMVSSSNSIKEKIEGVSSKSDISYELYDVILAGVEK